MIIPIVPTELAEQVGYLLDRTAISDLLIAYSRTIDTKDWQGYEDLLTEDGIIEIPIELPDGSFVRHVGRQGTAEWVAGSETHPGLGHFVQTHHLSANHQIEIEGDTANTHSYAHVVHRLNDDLDQVWEVGGWYSCELRRVGTHDWKFARIRLDMVWEHGKPSSHG